MEKIIYNIIVVTWDGHAAESREERSEVHHVCDSMKQGVSSELNVGAKPHTALLAKLYYFLRETDMLNCCPVD